MNKLTPNLIVSEIEACLPFWVQRLGFEKTVEVPEGDKLGFVILKRGAVEVMLQSRASLAKESHRISEGPHRSVLYIEVADLAVISHGSRGVAPGGPERKTFYGAQELIVADPVGNYVFFSSH